MNKKRLFIRLAALALCFALGGAMMIIGRGHTIYLDNKTLEDYNGQTYSSYHHVNVIVKGETVAKLDKRERGATTWLGQNFKMTLEITEKKGDEPVIKEVNISLPYSMDNIIINMPAYMAGLPEEAWLTEFIPTPSAEEEEDEDLSNIGDETSGLTDGEGELMG